jgi:hypothetical protein
MPKARGGTSTLATTTRRLAINVHSARSRRERYAARWLPEAVDTSADPELRAERGEALQAGILLLLETLSPTERAAYILREAFDYTHRNIANALRLEEPAGRARVGASGPERPAHSGDGHVARRPAGHRDEGTVAPARGDAERLPDSREAEAHRGVR